MRERIINKFVELMKAHGWEYVNSTNVFTDKFCRLHFKAFIERNCPNSNVAQSLLREFE